MSSRTEDSVKTEPRRISARRNPRELIGILLHQFRTMIGIYRNGKAFDRDLEHEIKDESPMGMTVGTKDQNDNIEIFYNVSEVHWNYNKGRGDAAMVAIESNFHGTGSTRFTAELVWVEITPAKAFHPNF